MEISKHITLEEATQSPTALRLKIINEPNEQQLASMRLVAGMVFEPLRMWYDKPIKINSFFRCNELNKAVGGATNSQYAKGEAIDISAGSKEENKKLYDYIKANLIFDQLINEYDYTWVHISYKVGMNRNQTLAVV